MTPTPSGTPTPEWRCFHCGRVCTTETEALNHFGRTLEWTPACQGNGSYVGQRLRWYVNNFLRAVADGKVKLSTDEDETLANVLKGMRLAADGYLAEEPNHLRADRDRLREALKVAQPAITQAMDYIRGETPEDCSPGEAEDSTFSKLRDADAAIDEALQSSTGAA